jgi:predicted lipoprotein with Yx(FWY)xxD motif
VRQPFLPRTVRSHPRRALGALLAPVAIAVVAAGCGGGGGSSGAATNAASAATPMHGAAATVTTRHTSVGTVLVDSQGRTLYLFKKDEGAMSTCYGSCASLWPPLTTDGKASAGKGVVAGKLGTSKRTDGATEVTYAGHPLYTYAGDAKPGDVNGQGLDQFGAEWDALPPSGAEDDD